MPNLVALRKADYLTFTKEGFEEAVLVKTVDDA